MKEGVIRGRRRGKYSAVDGLDGVGKGEVERAIIEVEQKLGRTTFDTISFSKAHAKGLPEVVDFYNPPETRYDTLIVAEPTYAGAGLTIRTQIINKDNKGKYTARDEIEAYALDRKVQMRQVVIPALENGLNVESSRCLAASLTYQMLRAQEERRSRKRTWKEILDQEGNKLQLRYAPDLLIIPTIEDARVLQERLKRRGESTKEDHSRFENFAFQQKLKPLYESERLRRLFEDHGTQVVYINAGISEQETRRQTREVYKGFLDGNIPNRYKTVSDALSKLRPTKSSQ